MNSNSRMTENEYVFDECPTCGCQTAGELSKLVAHLREHLAVARECLQWLESGLAGMFGTQGKSARDEFYETAPKVVHDCLARIGGGKVECKHCDDELPGAHRCSRKTADRMRGKG